MDTTGETRQDSMTDMLTLPPSKETVKLVNQRSLVAPFAKVLTTVLNVLSLISLLTIIVDA